MTYSVNDILGEWPNPLSWQYEQKIRSVASVWREACPVERGTAYYFDNDAGDDTTGDGSEGNPWQTITKANTVTGADVRIRLKRGSMWRTDVGLDIQGGSVDAYGTGDLPFLNAFTVEISAGTAAWTNSAGDRWTATAPAASFQWRNQADRLYVYRRLASTAEVEAVPYSFFVSGTTVHINAGAGIDPNTIDWEATPTSGTGDDGVLSTAEGFYMGYFRAEGHGLYSTALVQIYGARGALKDDEVGVMEGATARFNPRHNLGTIISGSPNAGGRLLIKDCLHGGTMEAVGTSTVSYAHAGGNECIILDSVCDIGAIPTTGSMIAAGTGHYAHTNGGADKIGYHAMIGCSIAEGGNAPPSDFAFAADTPGDNTDPTSLRVVQYKCSTPLYTPGAGTNAVFARTGIVHVACDYRAVLGAVSSRGFSGGNILDGWNFACRIQIDYTPAVTGPYGWTNGSVGNYNRARVINCDVLQSNSGTQNVGGEYDFLFGGLISNGFTSTARVVNSIIRSTAGATTVYAGWGNEAANANTNAYYNILGSAGTTAARDRGNHVNPIALATDLGTGLTSTPEALKGIGKTDETYLAEVNYLGQRVATPGLDIGPYQAAAGSSTLRRGRLEGIIGKPLRGRL